MITLFKIDLWDLLAPFKVDRSRPFRSNTKSEDFTLFRQQIVVLYVLNLAKGVRKVAVEEARIVSQRAGAVVPEPWN